MLRLTKSLVGMSSVLVPLLGSQSGLLMWGVRNVLKMFTGSILDPKSLPAKLMTLIAGSVVSRVVSALEQHLTHEGVQE